jgi:MFS family permease
MPGPNRLLRYVRSLDPRLSRAVWKLELGFLLNSFGTGVSYPFLIIYLHNVRGIGLATAGLVLATIGAAGLAASLIAGSLVDRAGPRRLLTASLGLLVVGYALFPLVHEPWEAFASALLVGAGSGVFWPAQLTLLSTLAPSGRRHAAWGLQRGFLNLGLGLGGLTGGLIARTEEPETFTVLFLVNVAATLGYGAVLVRLRGVTVARPAGAGLRRRGGYREALRHRAFVGLVALNVVLIAVGNAQLELLPVFAKNEAGVSETGIGLVFAAAMLALVLFQLPVARALEGRSRMRGLALAPLLWAAAWLVVDAGGAWLEAAAAAAVFAGAAVVYGLGECFHGPNYGPLVADLAPSGLEGRYWALSTGSWELGYVVGPAVGGAVLAAAPLALWPLAAGVCALAAVAALLLERSIPAELRSTPTQSGEAGLAPTS